MSCHTLLPCISPRTFFIQNQDVTVGKNKNLNLFYLFFFAFLKTFLNNLLSFISIKQVILEFVFYLIFCANFHSLFVTELYSKSKSLYLRNNPDIHQWR